MLVRSTGEGTIKAAPLPRATTSDRRKRADPCFLLRRSRRRTRALSGFSSVSLLMEAATYEEARRLRQPMRLQLRQQHLQAMPGPAEGGEGAAVVGDGTLFGGAEVAGAPEAGDGGVGPRPNQLTLSFQGQVYVFDAVPTEKVQSVLLFLGGQEVPPEVTYMTEPFCPNNSVSDDVPQSSNNNHRQASLMRFKEKRKDRCFNKKIRYHVRKEVAQRMQRKKGQFVSSRVGPEDDAALGSMSSNLAQNTCQEEAQGKAFCQHCGCNQSSTPMMRRGPGGPKSLCNACGLMWATKGFLRDHSKASATDAQILPANAHGMV